MKRRKKTMGVQKTVRMKRQKSKVKMKRPRSNVKTTAAIRIAIAIIDGKSLID